MEQIVIYLLIVQRLIICKAKDPKIKTYPLCLGNASVDFSANNMINTGLNGSVYNFFVGYNLIDNSNIINIHRYLMKKHGIAQNVWIY